MSSTVLRGGVEVSAPRCVAATDGDAPPRGAVPRVAVLCDLVEERWPSMDLVAEMLLLALREGHCAEAVATRVCPPMRRRFTPAPAPGPAEGGGAGRLRLNLDRGLNRFWDYPRHLRRVRDGFDVFHVVDHAYGQLVHHLPPGRTVVTCHDLHTFQCLLEPHRVPRSALFRSMTRHVLRGLTRAARVVFDTEAVRDEAVARGVVDPARATVAHLGVHPAYSPDPDPRADAEATRLLGPLRDEAPEVLHVGGTFARKRIDLLLQIFAEVRRRVPGARLVRVGGEFTDAQLELVRGLGLGDAVVVLPFMERSVSAAVYRRAALTVLPSEEEGFGLPVIEAMTCATPVVASGLAVLREVGGDAATYVPVGEVTQWGEVVVSLLEERTADAEGWRQRRMAGLAQAAGFTWAEYARKMVTVYREVLDP